MIKYIALFLLIFTPLTSFGQSDATAGYHYRAISWEGSIKNELYRREGDHYAPINLYSTARTEPFWHAGGNPITFYSKQTGANNTESYTPAVSANVPDSIKQPLFIFTKNRSQNGGASYKILVLDDSVNTCPPGSYRFMNWTDKNIAGRLGKQTFTIAPKAGKTIDPTSTPDPSLTIQLVELTDPENKRLYASRWVNQANARKLVLMVPREELGRSSVRIKIIADYTDPSVATSTN
ncbi:hypothetical protein [Cerasicoccus frondis]|uniref:hypothetical protein n=1 Tax=Cerasicoccus frondis TaxID=490090 RepID=UPI002852B3C4|nr:hypothetical protein [Cerasicoccus frondis]